jgi:hypothetical protein
LSHLEGRFESICGQLRDIQLYMHAKFDELDKRFDRMDAKLTDHDRCFNTLKRKVDALPRATAELSTER